LWWAAPLTLLTPEGRTLSLLHELQDTGELNTCHVYVHVRRLALLGGEMEPLPGR
jgi:hypothetical protein